MTFSIAIPVHNGEKFLKATLASAINQKRPADEIIAVDDASTDQSAQILKDEQWKGKIRYVFNETPSGYVDAWNRVVEHSHSDFVTILHQDDLLDADYLFRVEEALRTYPSCKHLFSGYYYIDDRGNRTAESPAPHSLNPELIPGKEYARRYLRGVFHNRHIHRCPGVTTERALLLDKCAYRKEAGLIADDDFFIRVGRFTDVVGISYPLASFRIHDESATAKLKSLAFQLANDYVFSLKFHDQHREYLDDHERAIIAGLAARFVSQLLFDGLRMRNDQWIESAVNLSVMIDAISSDWKQSFLPFWSKIMWSMQKKSANKELCWVYCSFLYRVNSMKNYGKAEIHKIGKR